MHSGPTHGLGAALVAGACAWSSWLRVGNDRDRLVLAIACVAAYASHTLLDWLGTDTSPPLGIMALWPFSTTYYEAPWHIFMAVSRRFRQPDLFWDQNIRALMRELLILVPVVIAVAWVRRATKSIVNR
jgi:hypothetical protein